MTQVVLASPELKQEQVNDTSHQTTVGQKPAKESVSTTLSVTIAIAVYAVLLITYFLAPAPLNDEGGYINMLNTFFSSGQMDLMRWSQPTFIGTIPLAFPMHALGIDPNYALAGAVASIIAIATVIAFTKSVQNTLLAVVLSASLFAFPDFVNTAVAAMSDQFFLAYFGLCLFALRKCLRKPTALNLIALALTFSLAALTRAHAFTLPVSILLASGFKPSRSALKASGALFACIPVVVLISATLTKNKIPLTEMTTVLPIIHGQLALLDLRATVHAIFDVALAFAPVSILVCNYKRFGRYEVGGAVCALAICVKFLLKDHSVSNVLPGLDALSTILIPISCALLVNVLRIGPWNNTMFKACMFCAAGTILVMPIMPHPMSRHALPTLMCLIVGISSYKFSERAISKLPALCSGLMITLLVSLNLFANFQDRVRSQKNWDACVSAVNKGILAKDIYGGWNWFCFTEMDPAHISDYDYQKNYKERELKAPYVISNGVLEERK